MNQQLYIQRQQFRREQVELESALEQLQDDSVSYKMIGSLMVQQDPKKIKAELQTQLEDVKKQIAILDEQIDES